MDSLQSQGSDHEMCSRAAQLFNVTAEDSSEQSENICLPGASVYHHQLWRRLIHESHTHINISNNQSATASVLTFSDHIITVFLPFTQKEELLLILLQTSDGKQHGERSKPNRKFSLTSDIRGEEYLLDVVLWSLLTFTQESVSSHRKCELCLQLQEHMWLQVCL